MYVLLLIAKSITFPAPIPSRICSLAPQTQLTNGRWLARCQTRYGFLSQLVPREPTRLKPPSVHSSQGEDMTFSSQSLCPFFFLLQASLFGHQALVDVIMAEKARAGYAAALALYSRLETLPDTTRENRARQRNEEARTLFAALTLDLEMQPCVGSEVASCAATRAAAMDRLHTLCKGAGAPSACQGILEELTTMETLAAVEQLGKMQQDASKVMVGEVPSARVPAAAVPADDASGKVGADPVTAKASVESVAPTEGGAPFESETPAESKAPTH